MNSDIVAILTFCFVCEQCAEFNTGIIVICKRHGLAPITVSLTSNRDRDDDNKHDEDYIYNGSIDRSICIEP